MAIKRLPNTRLLEPSMTDLTKKRAIIIGGSMAGLFCGVLLRRAGWQVDIYERAGEELANRGAGIATHDEMYAALRLAGIEVRPEMGVASQGRLVFAPDGSLLGQCEMPQMMTSWGFIYRFLRAQFPTDDYHNGYTLTSLEQQANGVEACFSNGQRERADWLIGADGTRSTVRACVAPQIEADYCGYFAWRGLVDEALLPPAVQAQLCNRFALNPADHGHLLGYMVAGPNDDLRPGHRWYNWGWYRRADAASLQAHLTDTEGQHHPQGIPHDRIRPEMVATLRAQAARELAPTLQAVIAATPQPFLQGIHEVRSSRMVYGRVVTIGDAAFTARPHVGLGVSKAAEDGTFLAQALLDETVAQWETQRLDYGHRAVNWGRRLGSYIETPSNDPAARATAAYYRRPDVLMWETAASQPQRYLAWDSPLVAAG